MHTICLEHCFLSLMLLSLLATDNKQEHAHLPDYNQGLCMSPFGLRQAKNKNVTLLASKLKCETILCLGKNHEIKYIVLLSQVNL